MKKDRKNLNNIITAILIKNNSNTKLRDKMMDELRNKFRTGVLTEIYNQNRQIIFVSDEELFLITKSLYDNYDLFSEKIKDYTRDEIDPDKWFTDNEKAEAHKIDIKYKKENDIYFELHNVDEVEQGVWICSHETYRNIADNWNRGALLYNPDTQREGIIKFVLGETYKVPKLYDKNVDEIYMNMKNKEFFINMLTVNIQQTGEEREHIEYFPERRILRVKKTENCRVYLTDGAHRLQAILKLLSDYPDFEGNIGVRIFNLDVSKAQASIIQESKGTPLDFETIRKFDKKNPYMQVAEKINDLDSEVTNPMYHKLTSYIEEVRLNQKYCLFSNVANGVQDNFSDIIDKLSDKARPRELDKIARYLVKFYGDFIGIFEAYFDDLDKTKENMVIADINIFSGILTIARRLYNVDGWQDILEDILSDIIWDRSNSIWTNVPTNSLTWNKSTKTKLYNCFNNVLAEKVGVI